MGLEDIFSEYADDKKEDKVKKSKKTESDEPKEEKPTEKPEKPTQTPQVETEKQDEVKTTESKEVAKTPEKTTPDVKSEPKEEPVKEQKSVDKVEPDPVVEEQIKEENTDSKYDLTPEEETSETVITVYGEKGDAKTSTAFSFPGEIVCLSFDRKSTPIKNQLEGRDITVYDGIRYLDKSSPEAWLNSSEVTWDYIKSIFRGIPDKSVDWFVIDGGEIFHTIAEMVMRSHHDLMPFQGVSNRNVWKERRMLIEQLLRLAQNKSKEGVIWTCYTREKKIVKEGNFESVEDIPAWIDAVLHETDVVIRVKRITDANGQRFTCHIDSSKNPSFETGKTVDITDKNAYKEMVK